MRFFQNSSNYCNKNWMTHYKKKRGYGFVQQSVKNVCAKFKVDRLSRFRTGVCHVLTTQEFFSTKIPLTRKLQHQIPSKHIFWSNYHLSSFFWKSLTSNKSILEWKSKYLNSIRAFPFLISFFCWNQTNSKFLIKEDRRKMENCKADI